MDWKKAKNILIVMFLIINIFLSYQLYTINRSQYKYIDKDEIESVLQFMKSKNINLNTQIPTSINVIPSLRVKYFEYDAKTVEKALYPDDKNSFNLYETGFSIDNGSLAVEVKNKVYMSYKNRTIAIESKKISENKCLDNAYAFIEKLQLDMSNKYVIQKEVQEGFVKLVLGQQYKNIPVENSRIEIIATETGVAEANLNWFEYIRTEKKENIITPIVALLKAFEKKGDADNAVTVNQIRQGYFLNTGIQTQANSPIIVEGTAYPMWVIGYDKNEVYINAYNEEIEKVK